MGSSAMLSRCGGVNTWKKGNWRRLAFTYRYQGQPYEVDIHQDEGGDYSVRHEKR